MDQLFSFPTFLLSAPCLLVPDEATPLAAYCRTASPHLKHFAQPPLADTWFEAHSPPKKTALPRPKKSACDEVRRGVHVCSRAAIELEGLLPASAFIISRAHRLGHVSLRGASLGNVEERSAWRTAHLSYARGVSTRSIVMDLYTSLQ